MATREQLLAEAQRRGLTPPPDKAALLAEAERRGLQIPQVPEPEPMSKWDAVKQGFGMTKDAYQGNAEFKDAGGADQFVINQANKGRYKDDGIFTKDRFFQDLLAVQSASVFGNDEDVQNQLKAIYGKDAQPTNDANGNLMVTDGEKAEYINKPGFDTQDLANITGEAASYLPALKVAKVANNPLVRSGLTALGTGITNAINQKGAGREDIDATEVAITGALGGGAELGSHYAGKLFNWAKNKLSGSGEKIKKGAEIASRNGINNMDDESLEALGTMRGAVNDSIPDDALIAELAHGLKLTRGQATGNITQLSKEQGLRNQTGLMKNFQQVDDFNRDKVESGLRGIRANMYGGTDDALQPAASAEVARDALTDAAAKAKGAYQQAYQEVGDLSVKGDRSLAQNILNKVRKTIDIDDTTPKTKAALESINDRLGQLPADDALSMDAYANMRKRISSKFSAGMDGTDKKALTMVKNELDDWFYSSVDDSLLSGSPEQLKKLHKARGLMTDYMNRFQSKDKAKKVITNIVNDGVTPEEFSNMMVGVNGYSKQGASNAVKAYKEAVGVDSEGFKALQANVFEKLIVGGVNPKTGSATIKGYEGLSGAFHQAYNTKGASMMKQLYDNKTANEIKSLMTSVRKLITPNEVKNASGSGRLMAQIMSQHGNKFPIISDIWNGAKNAIKYSNANSLPMKSANEALRQSGALLQTIDK